MTRRSARPIQRTCAIWRGAEQWLLATVLLVFGAAAVVSLPASASLDAKVHARSAIDAKGAADVRFAARSILRAVQPKDSGGGKDLVPARVVKTLYSISWCDVWVVASGDRARTFVRPFNARAPPVLMA